MDGIRYNAPLAVLFTSLLVGTSASFSASESENEAAVAAGKVRNAKLASLSPGAAGNLEKDSLILNTRKSLQLYGQGRLPEAAVMQHQLVLSLKGKANSSPAQGAAHAALSFLAWQQGNAILALEEGEKAAKLCPQNAGYLYNLALMKETLSDYEVALKTYEQVLSLDPTFWKAKLNVCRCLFKLSRQEEARRYLEESFVSRSSENRSYQMLIGAVDLALQGSENELAVNGAEKALGLASTEAEKNEASANLLLALLRAGKLEKAAGYRHCLLAPGLKADYELYLRALEQTVPAIDPGSAKEIVEAVLKKFHRQEDAEGIYRLGRICQAKCIYVSYDRNKSGLWKELARQAYERAVQLDGLQARYHLALAGAMEASADSSREMLRELRSAAALDKFDPLASYLSLAAEKHEEVPGSTLEKVTFKIEGLSCGCHVGKLESVFAKQRGLVFVSISRQEPLRAVLLIDSSATNEKEILDACLAQFNSDPLQAQSKTPSKIVFSQLEKEEVDKAEEAIRIAQNATCGSPLEFYVQFKAEEPQVPYI